jgi:hypothetical protein
VQNVVERIELLELTTRDNTMVRPFKLDVFSVPLGVPRHLHIAKVRQWFASAEATMHDPRCAATNRMDAPIQIVALHRDKRS